MIPILFGVLLLTFVVSHVVTPYPARAWAGPRASESTVQTIANRYHLNDPLPIQFYYYLSDLFRGDWGVSPSTGQPVLANILAFFPATIELTIVAFLLSVAVGIPLGVVSAVHRDQPVDHLLRLVSLSGIASPPFLVALLMQLILFYYLRIFPESGGRISPLISPPTHITGLFLVDSLLTGNLPAFVSSLQHILMPALALALVTFGLATRLTRASMLEVLRTDYVRTARAKGLNNRTVIYKHALRNALISTTTIMSSAFAFLLGGTVVIETIFSWPGIGRYAAQAVLNLDFPAIMGTTLVFALGVVLCNLVADTLYALLDPRIKLG